WLLRGKAYLKSRIAVVVRLDVRALPYNSRLLEYLREQKERGRQVFLASASVRRLLVSIAAQLGFFVGVFATHGGVNLKGSAKASAIAAHAPGRAFAYAGNESADLPIWASAAESIVVNASESTVRAARKRANVTEVFPASRGGLK